MSDLIVSADDLGVYLSSQGLSSSNFNTARATQLLIWAQQLCETEVSPLPTGAEPIVIDVAQRMYTNPTNVTQQSVLNASASYGGVRGGIWLTKANKAALRRLSGKANVWEVDMTQTEIPGPPAQLSTAGFDVTP
jgi:hypothetical protein